MSTLSHCFLCLIHADRSRRGVFCTNVHTCKDVRRLSCFCTIYVRAGVPAILSFCITRPGTDTRRTCRRRRDVSLVPYIKVAQPSPNPCSVAPPPPTLPLSPPPPPGGGTETSVERLFSAPVFLLRRAANVPAIVLYSSCMEFEAKLLSTRKLSGMTSSCKTAGLLRYLAHSFHSISQLKMRRREKNAFKSVCNICKF